MNGNAIPSALSKRLRSAKGRGQVNRSGTPTTPDSVPLKGKGKGKGKGKATLWDSDDEDDDDAYVTSNDYATPERRRRSSQGTAGFGDGGPDDGELYD